jgi:hypothetical protein
VNSGGVGARDGSKQAASGVRDLGVLQSAQKAIELDLRKLRLAAPLFQDLLQECYRFVTAECGARASSLNTARPSSDAARSLQNEIELVAKVGYALPPLGQRSQTSRQIKWALHSEGRLADAIRRQGSDAVALVAHAEPQVTSLSL